MTDTDSLLVVFVTAPDESVAATLARALLAARAAACVNVVGSVRSFYRWRGETQEAPEVQLVVKTRASKLDDVKRVVREKHPYELPELIALPIVDGAPDYLAWVRDETR